ncbi:MAG: hypothetical protein ACK4YU_07020 [Paracoccus sp. (in: a-proteobacteria)]
MIRMPEAEAAHLVDAYRKARVILEYGSGDSTRRAAELGQRLIISVESDLKWARDLRQEIETADPFASVVIHHADIGPTGAWGRALDDRAWQRFHLYPNGVWDQPFFRHPDVVLIDGRFRTACLMAVMMRITRPVTVLFDDYIDRPRYQLIERIIRPVLTVGRMAEFHVTPGLLGPEDMGFAVAQFFEHSLHGQGQAAYRTADRGMQDTKGQ